MPSYKLIYFDIRGRAETSRWLFKLSGVEFEDVRINFEKWGEKKKELDPPFGQLPILEITEETGTWTLAQSQSIERYLAKQFGLSGKCKKDEALGDSYMEQLTDVVLILPWKEKDEEKKKELMAEGLNGEIGEKLQKLEDCVQDNGVFVGHELSLADVSFAMRMEYITQYCPNALNEMPKLKALNEKVRSVPGIASWIAERPTTKL